MSSSAPPPASSAVEVRVTPAGATLWFTDHTVVKEHAARTARTELVTRLRLAGTHPAFVPPLVSRPLTTRDGRPLTVWPRVAVATPTDPALPWAEAGRLLAGLHRSPAAPDLPAHCWPARLDRAAGRAPSGLVMLGEQLSAQLAGRAEPRVLVHGDWHLGQLGSWAAGWRLIDIDDLGVGDPAWDLARPAGFWAAGLLGDADWHAFLDAYRTAGGPAVPPAGDPWPTLDLPARVAVYVAAVRALREPSHSEGTADALVEACRAMAQ